MVEVRAATVRQKPDADQSPHAVGVGSKCFTYFAESAHVLLTHEIFADTACMLSPNQGFLLTASFC